jgi:UDP-N-acetylglucosamine/UDP-N-acetylgalactosamine diphosphorylase
MPDRLDAARARLAAHGQEHLLAFAAALPPARLASLLDQIDALDLDEIDDLIARYVRVKPETTMPGDLAPAPYYPNNPASAGRSYDAAKFRSLGEQLIRAGKLAAFCVAGGQGTRLGWNGPKGTFPATPVTGKPLFRVFAEQIIAAQRRYGVTIPWYIMTSPINDADTRAFFRDNNNFGIARRDIFMFPQGVMPSFDRATGRMLLAERHELAVNPDGHGGSIRALAESRAIDDMGERGVEHISYFQVDNPLVKIVDPLFFGLHAHAADSSAEMSSKMLPKANAAEKVGVFCRAGGKTMVIEYSDLPPALAAATNADRSLRFLAGSIAIHLLGVRFVERLTEGATFALPWHRADKKVPFIDPGTGARVEPTEPNGVKLETFVFDAIPLAASSIVYETSRAEEFAPIKNATGVDSAESSAQIQSDRNGAWLEQHGVRVPRRADGRVDARIEISPLTALEPSDLSRLALPREVRAGDELSL